MHIEIAAIPLGFAQCYVLKGDGVVVVDSGGPGKGDVFKRSLETRGVPPREVKLVVLTHGHYDHIGSARDIKALTGAGLAMHRAEAHWLENSLKPLSPGITAWGRLLNVLQAPFLPFIKIPSSEVDVVIDDDGLVYPAHGKPFPIAVIEKAISEFD